MQAHDPNTLDDPIERWSHRFWLIVPVLLLLACCWWSRVWAYLPPLRALWVNHLDQVQGQATLLAPGQWQPRGADLAPDGRRMVLGWQREAQREAFVWDLTTDQRLPLPSPILDIRWLSTQYLALISNGDYWIVDARDGSKIALNLVPQSTYRKLGGFAHIEQILRAADQMYVVELFGGVPSQMVIFQHQEQWELADLGDSEQFGLSRDELEAALNAIPHVDVPEYGWGTPAGTGSRIYSPDRRFYAAREAVDAYGSEQVVIYTRDDTVVARAYKDEWFPDLLGWAHDSSGVYFQMTYEHAPTTVVPEAPLFKLAPLSPQEQQREDIKRIGLWSAGLIVLAGAGWWLWWRKPWVSA